MSALAPDCMANAIAIPIAEIATIRSRLIRLNIHSSMERLGIGVVAPSPVAWVQLGGNSTHKKPDIASLIDGQCPALGEWVRYLLCGDTYIYIYMYIWCYNFFL